MGKGKILIVDDEYQGRRLLSEICECLGLEADCAENGADALFLLEKGPYNLIMVDYRMPMMNGVEFVTRVRRKWTSLPVIAMSADEVNDLFIKAGADLFFKKPFDYRLLETAIKTMLAD